jgi:hypothetical protein
MHYAVMSINAIPPQIYEFSPERVPFSWKYDFLKATVYHLLLAKLMKLQRKDMDYSAGNMSVDLYKRQIEYLFRWSQIFKAEFEAGIRDKKRTANLEDAYGSTC